MGVVYEIEHVRLKKRYVAKIIHEQIKEDKGAAKRMEREAQVLAGITHPNIVQVHDVGITADGVSYFVMEKLEGADLRQTMKRHSMSRKQALGVVADVLSALEYVHSRGIVHRDIKPENIFIAEQPQGLVTKVLDFGIVHIFDRDGHVSRSKITKTGGFVGTLYYAAPEHLQGEGTGPASDVYAAGLVLFEMLAGRGPFDHDPGVGLSRCFKPAPMLDQIVPGAPRAVSELLARALERDAGARPSAASFATELRNIATTIDDAPLPPSMQVVEAPVPPEGTAAPPTPVMPGARANTPNAHEATLAVAGVQPVTGPQPAPARVPTSGGVYATVDRQGQSPTPSRSRAGLMAALVVTPLVLAASIAGVLFMRSKAPAASVTTASATAPASTPLAPAATPASSPPAVVVEEAKDAGSTTTTASDDANPRPPSQQQAKPAVAPAKPVAPATKPEAKPSGKEYVPF
jgi:serine/threonine-protein kinase